MPNLSWYVQYSYICSITWSHGVFLPEGSGQLPAKRPLSERRGVGQLHFVRGRTVWTVLRSSRTPVSFRTCKQQTQKLRWGMHHQARGVRPHWQLRLCLVRKAYMLWSSANPPLAIWSSGEPCKSKSAHPSCSSIWGLSTKAREIKWLRTVMIWGVQLSTRAWLTECLRTLRTWGIHFGAFN